MSSLPREKMKGCDSGSTNTAVHCSKGNDLVNPNASTVLERNDLNWSNRSTSQKTSFHKTDMVITSDAQNCTSNIQMEATLSLKRKPSSNGHLHCGYQQYVSASQNGISSNLSCNSHSGSSDCTPEKISRYNCMFPGACSFYKPSSQSCESSCCQYFSFEQVSGLKFLTDMNGRESANSCRDTASAILKSVLLNEQKLLRQKKFCRARVLSQRKTEDKHKIPSNEKFCISITRREVITPDTQRVCLKTLTGNSEPDASKIFKIISRGSQPNFFKRASDFCLDDSKSDLISSNFLHQVKNLFNPCPKSGTQVVLDKLKDYQVRKGDVDPSQHLPTMASCSNTTNTVDLNYNLHLMQPSTSRVLVPSTCQDNPTASSPSSRSLVRTCRQTSTEKGPVSEQTNGEAKSHRSLSKSLPKSTSEKSVIPYLTVKRPSPLLKRADHAEVIKLFIGDLYNLRATPKERHFFYFDSVIHKVNICGTITSIQKCSPNKYVYEIEDNSGIVSCAHVLSEFEADRMKYYQFLSQLEDLWRDDSTRTNVSQLSWDEDEDDEYEYESALRELQAAAKAKLDENLGKCPFKLGNTVSAIGVIVEYKNKWNLLLYDIYTMKSGREMQDWIQELIILYKWVYPKSIKGFARA